MELKTKKLAVLVFGMFREFEHAHKTWSFLNDFEYDIFFSTWDRTYEENILLNIEINESIEKERILKYFPNAFINIESESDVDIVTNACKMQYHWKKLFELTKSSDFTYEYALLIRPDLYIKENGFSNLLKNFNKNHILGVEEVNYKPPPWDYFVGDFLFFGKYDLMQDIFLSYNPPEFSPKYFHYPPSHHSHYHLVKHFVLNNIYVEEISRSVLDTFILRSIHRNFLNLDFQTLKKLGREWQSAKIDGTEALTFDKLKNNPSKNSLI